MFNTEKPIKSHSDDLLGYYKVAKELSNKVVNYSEEDSLTIGILGEWGSGKTSFINLALEEMKDQKDFIIVKFNPWIISTRKQLISDFFTLLSDEIGREDNKKCLREIGQSLNKLSKVFKPMSLIPSLSLVVPQLEKITESVGGVLELCGSEDNINLDQIKDELDEKLIESNKKIIIVIDDIDRLVDKEIKEIFQLVRSIADFKNTIYLLSYDTKIVSKALDTLQHERGEKYLEKIIQIPLCLPYVNKSEIDKIFLQRLDTVLDISEEEFDRDYFSELYNNGLSGNFHNLRELSRFFNVLIFGITLAKEELNIYDYVAITLLKVLEPELYNYIQSHKENFTGTKFGNKYGFYKKEMKEKTKIDLDKLLNKTKKMSKKNAQNLIKTLFPKIESIYSNKSYGDDFIPMWNKKRRVVSYEYFESYFKLSFPENEIKKIELENIKNFSSREELKRLFMMNNSKKLKFLDRILEIADEIKEDNIVIFLQVILSLTDNLKNEGPIGIFSSLNDPKYKVTRIFFKVIKNIDLSNRFKIVKDVFQDERCSLETLFSILDILKKGLVQDDTSYHYEITVEEINELLHLLTTRIIDRSKNLDKIPKNFLEILYSMKRLGKLEEAKDLFENYVKKPTSLISLLNSFISVSITETGYTVIENKYIKKSSIDDFFDYNNLIKIVEEQIKNPTKEELETIGYLKDAKKNSD